MMWLMRLWAARAGEGRPRRPQATTVRGVRRVGSWRRASASPHISQRVGASGL